jgi:hypothetical protein
VSRKAPGDAGENLVAFSSSKNAIGIAQNYVVVAMEKKCTMNKIIINLLTEILEECNDNKVFFGSLLYLLAS